jgi:hypothetical protein
LKITKIKIKKIKKDKKNGFRRNIKKKAQTLTKLRRIIRPLPQQISLPLAKRAQKVQKVQKAKVFQKQIRKKRQIKQINEKQKRHKEKRQKAFPLAQRKQSASRNQKAHASANPNGNAFQSLFDVPKVYDASGPATNFSNGRLQSDGLSA